MTMIAHIVLNSHLDPIWRWKREQGICEVLATAHSACGILDDYPEAIITRGEAWFYETIERLDPALFSRIRNYVEQGRWKVVGNWYIQPDCNLASPETYLKHGEIAGKYFREKFGVEVKTGYNVDSFGHGAMLPDFYNACGVENYVMMRPGKHEMELPANDFIWRTPNGGELTVTRIIDAYGTWPDGLERHFNAVFEEMNTELGHVLMMFGCGNHGCGPFRSELDWLLRNWNNFPGVEFRFSHPDAYFEAVKSSGVKLPVVTGELQHHAVGCYSIVSRIKREVRSTENALIQRGRFLPEEQQEKLWKKLLFATFHDILPGSSVASAYQDVYDELGEVRSAVNEAVVADICKRNIRLEDADDQRLIFDNPGDEPFSGVLEFEPWFSLLFHDELKNGGEGLALVDENGNDVPWQLISAEAAAAMKQTCRMAICLDIPPRGRRILQAVRRKAPAIASAVAANAETVTAGDITAGLDKTGIVSLKRNGFEFLGGAPQFQVIDDPSDTWSHFQFGYPAETKRIFRNTTPWQQFYPGPLLGAAFSEWEDDDRNRIKLLARADAGTAGVQMVMRVNWHGDSELLKLAIPLSFKVDKWTAGCPGGTVERRVNDREYPVFNTIVLSGEGHTLTLVTPDIYSADVLPDGKTLRLTLLRSAVYAYSQDSIDFRMPENHFYNITDQGCIDFHLLMMPDASAEEIKREMYRFTEPVKYSELTRGIRIRRDHAFIPFTLPKREE